MKRRGVIRWHLFRLQLVSMVPIGLLAAALLYLHWQAQEHERERSQLESVRLLAAAVDNSLDSTIERLSIFARLWASSTVDERTIYQQAREALAANQDWADILAYRVDGQGVFNAREPFDQAVQASERLDLWRPLIEERRAVVSDVFVSQRRGVVVSVGVPMIRNGQVTHLLIADLDFGWYDELLGRQGVDAGAIAGILDRNYKFVARSTEGDLRRGADPTPEVASDMRLRREGVERYVNLNGTPVYTTWTFTRHGWGVAFATPSAPVDDAFWSHLAWFGLLWVGALVAGLAYAFAKARPVASALESLEGQAVGFASGQRLVGLPDSGVEEIDRAVVALEKASELLQTTTLERDRAFATEYEARAAAEAANRAKDEFLAMLGHELRNPLAAISSATAILQSRRSSPEQLDFASAVIQRQSENLKRLIDDLLDVGRAMNDKIVLDRTHLDLAACARHVVTTLRDIGRLTDRKVELDAASVWIDGDRTRVEQVLVNLIVNAARYTPPGGVIRVHVAREGKDAVLRVEDDGAGITAEDLPRVFELFFQGGSTANRTGGLGIGLTLVRRLAHLHGGEVAALSAGRGRGATFTVRLPASTAADRAPAVPVEETTEPLTILLVEDNTDARESLRMALELHGHRVLEAADARAALETLRREHPAVALFDIGLPDMDGYELARRARAEFGDALVLIALTGYGTASDERSALDAGFDRHVAKPIDVATLLQVLERTIRRRGAAA